MRGRPPTTETTSSQSRLTPANAGTTADNSHLLGRVKAHPRECGDDRDCFARAAPYTGSPPRMRGRPLCCAPSRWVLGLTPANAGTTVAPAASAPTIAAHPRECGDDAGAAEKGVPCDGSPPRMRGRLDAGPPPERDVGLTPANAGTTSDEQTGKIINAAHPRECGDDDVAVAGVPRGVGSPPRMRGRRTLMCGWRPDCRLTPANAGTTSSLPPGSYTPTAHPRECGDDGRTGGPGCDGEGSPPRMRGRLSQDVHQPRDREAHPRECGDDSPNWPVPSSSQWLTPANAGTTRGRYAAGSSPGAHPRECGDDSVDPESSGL